MEEAQKFPFEQADIAVVGRVVAHDACGQALGVVDLHHAAVESSPQAHQFFHLPGAVVDKQSTGVLFVLDRRGEVAILVEDAHCPSICVGEERYHSVTGIVEQFKAGVLLLLIILEDSHFLALVVHDHHFPGHDAVPDLLGGADYIYPC